MNAFIVILLIILLVAFYEQNQKNMYRAIGGALGETCTTENTTVNSLCGVTVYIKTPCGSYWSLDSSNHININNSTPPTAFLLSPALNGDPNCVTIRLSTDNNMVVRKNSSSTWVSMEQIPSAPDDSFKSRASFLVQTDQVCPWTFVNQDSAASGMILNNYSNLLFVDPFQNITNKFNK